MYFLNSSTNISIHVPLPMYQLNKTLSITLKPSDSFPSFIPSPLFLSGQILCCQLLILIYSFAKYISIPKCVFFFYDDSFKTWYIYKTIQYGQSMSCCFAQLPIYQIHLYQGRHSSFDSTNTYILCINVNLLYLFLC